MSREASNRTARGLGLTLVGRLAGMGLGLAVTVVLARALGPEGKGAHAFILLVPALFQAFLLLGLDQATTWAAARAPSRARSLAGKLTGVAVALALLGWGVYWALETFWPGWLGILGDTAAPRGLVWVALLALPFWMAGTVGTHILLGVQAFGRFNIGGVAVPALNLLLLWLFLEIFGWGLSGAVWATVAATVVGSLIPLGLVFALRVPGRTRDASEADPEDGSADAPPPLGEILHFGGRVHAGAVAWFLHYRSDLFLVGALGGGSALGFYSIAVGLAEKLYLLPSALGTVIFPRVAGGGENSAALTARASRLGLWITMAAALVLGALAPVVVPLLFGDDFRPALAPLFLLLPGVIALATGRVISSDLSARGRPEVTAKVNGALAVLNIALNVWWIPIFGPAGAAAATSVSYLLAVLLLARTFLAETGQPAHTLWRLTAQDRAQVFERLSGWVGLR